MTTDLDFGSGPQLIFLAQVPVLQPGLCTSSLCTFLQYVTSRWKPFCTYSALYPESQPLNLPSRSPTGFQSLRPWSPRLFGIYGSFRVVLSPSRHLGSSRLILDLTVTWSGKPCLSNSNRHLPLRLTLNLCNFSSPWGLLLPLWVACPTDLCLKCACVLSGFYTHLYSCAHTFYLLMWKEFKHSKNSTRNTHARVTQIHRFLTFFSICLIIYSVSLCSLFFFS